MILRFYGSPQYRASSVQPIEIGEAYEVAEIFEMEGHLMVRKPGEDRWPVPGSQGFGWMPEWFEPTEKPIPIISCGFRFNDFLTDFFGVILGPEQVEVVRALKDVSDPDDDEEFEVWRAREVAELPLEAAQNLFELMQLPVPLHFGAFQHVFLADEPLKSPFGFVGTFLAELARDDVSKDVVGEHLGRLLYSLEIRGFEVAEINLRFWEGTGGDRLINAPPDGRLVYGTHSEPVDDEPASG